MGADPVKEFEAYRQELLDLLGDEDPLDVLARTPRRIEERLRGLGEDRLALSPEEGVWSVKEVVGHLTDTEWVYGYRLRLMISHDRPRMPGYDQDVMVAGLRHNERPLSMLTEELRRLRGLNLDFYRRTRGPEWDRVGLHAERGEESVELTVRLLAGHDLRHLDQLERILEALEL